MNKSGDIYNTLVTKHLYKLESTEHALDAIVRVVKDVIVPKELALQSAGGGHKFTSLEDAMLFLLRIFNEFEHVNLLIAFCVLTPSFSVGPAGVLKVGEEILRRLIGDVTALNVDNFPQPGEDKYQSGPSPELRKFSLVDQLQKAAEEKSEQSGLVVPDNLLAELMKSQRKTSKLQSKDAKKVME